MKHKLNPMNNDTVKAIIFDLGKVCIDFDHMIAAKKIARFTNNKTADEIFNLFFDSEVSKQFEEGGIAPADFFSAMRTGLKLEIPYDEFLPIWNEIFFLTDNNIEVHRLIQLLRRDYTIAMLSNINILHFEYLKHNFSVFRLFNNMILSCEQHLRKPDRRLYIKTLEILNLEPQEVIYTDDRLEFIEEAKLLGIKSFYFQDAEKLKTDFSNTGINIDQ